MPPISRSFVLAGCIAETKRIAAPIGDADFFQKRITISICEQQGASGSRSHCPTPSGSEVAARNWLSEHTFYCTVRVTGTLFTVLPSNAYT